MQSTFAQPDPPHGPRIRVPVAESAGSGELGRQRAQQQRAVVLRGELDRLLALVFGHLQILHRHSSSRTHSPDDSNPNLHTSTRTTPADTRGSQNRRYFRVPTRKKWESLLFNAFADANWLFQTNMAAPRRPSPTD